MPDINAASLIRILTSGSIFSVSLDRAAFDDNLALFRVNSFRSLCGHVGILHGNRTFLVEDSFSGALRFIGLRNRLCNYRTVFNGNFRAAAGRIFAVNCRSHVRRRRHRTVGDCDARGCAESVARAVTAEHFFMVSCIGLNDASARNCQRTFFNKNSVYENLASVDFHRAFCLDAFNSVHGYLCRGKGSRNQNLSSAGNSTDVIAVVAGDSRRTFADEITVCLESVALPDVDIDSAPFFDNEVPLNDKAASRNDTIHCQRAGSLEDESLGRALEAAALAIKIIRADQFNVQRSVRS